MSIEAKLNDFFMLEATFWFFVYFYFLSSSRFFLPSDLIFEFELSTEADLERIELLLFDFFLSLFFEFSLTHFETCLFYFTCFVIRPFFADKQEFELSLIEFL